MISHKLFAQVAVDAGKAQNIPEKNVIIFGSGPDSNSLPTIECAICTFSKVDELGCLMQAITFCCGREMVAKDLPFPNLPPVDPTAIVALPFSSGTTARPKVKCC